MRHSDPTPSIRQADATPSIASAGATGSILDWELTQGSNFGARLPLAETSSEPDISRFFSNAARVQESSRVPSGGGQIWVSVDKLLNDNLALVVERERGSDKHELGTSSRMSPIQFSISGTVLNFSSGTQFLNAVGQELIRARQSATPLEGLMNRFGKDQWHYFLRQHYEVVRDYPSAILRSFGGRFDSTNVLHQHMLGVFADELGGKMNENGQIFVRDRDSRDIREILIDWDTGSWSYSPVVTPNANSTAHSQLLQDPYAPPHFEMMQDFLNVILDDGWIDIGIGPETTNFLEGYGNLLLGTDKSADGFTMLTTEGELNFPSLARSMYAPLMKQDWVQERLNEFRLTNPGVNPNLYWDIHLVDDTADGHGAEMMNRAALEYPSPTNPFPEQEDTYSSKHLSADTWGALSVAFREFVSRDIRREQIQLAKVVGLEVLGSNQIGIIWETAEGTALELPKEEAQALRSLAEDFIEMSSKLGMLPEFPPTLDRSRPEVFFVHNISGIQAAQFIRNELVRGSLEEIRIDAAFLDHQRRQANIYWSSRDYDSSRTGLNSEKIPTEVEKVVTKAVERILETRMVRAEDISEPGTNEPIIPEVKFIANSIPVGSLRFQEEQQSSVEAQRDDSDSQEMLIWSNHLARRVRIAQALARIFSEEVMFEQGLSWSILDGSFRNHLQKAYQRH